MKCNTCNEPTKYILGLWDGPNGTYGRTYDCHNLNCELKHNRVRLEVDASREKELNTEINRRNKIFMELIRSRRRSLLITIMKMSRLLGISPATYSDYEMCRVALPVEMVERIEDVFREGRNEFVK